MFFSNSKDSMCILDSLRRIESYVHNEINAIEFSNDCSSKNNKEVMDAIIKLSNLLDEKRTEEITIYGEIMLSAEKLSDGYTEDRITKEVSNEQLNYIAKTFNTMSDKLEDSLTQIGNALHEYSQQNYMPVISEDLFRGGKLKELIVGINYLRKEISQNLMAGFRTSLVMQEESKHLLQNASTLSSATASQAASLEETAAAIEEITSTIANNTKTATTMSEQGGKVRESINAGLNLASSTVKAMDEINESTNAVHEATNLIDQIAFQTNILSLNAAVEAATAGEAGKGFAVVAQEVRNLAARSAEAAKQIKELVEQATLKADEGKEIADKMITGYENLNENISHTTELIDKVVTASHEQELGISQINNSITQIDTLTQQNAVVADNVKEVSFQMNRVANTNVELLKVSKFEGKEELQIRDINKRNSNYNGVERRSNNIPDEI